jgi:antitoxin YefM
MTEVKVMLTEIREKTVVKENGMVEISTPDLPIGTRVEVIVLIEKEEMDTTEYLLSTEANRKHLERAMRDAEDPKKRIYVDIENL